MEPRELTIGAALELLRSGDLSAFELVESCWEQIQDLNDDLRAFIHLRRVQDVLSDARAADKRRLAGQGSLLEGVPIALKANFALAGLPASAGSQILADWFPRQDAESVKALKSAGATIVGLTNMHEFADGPTSANPHYGNPVNPYDPLRIPGGSSGGSAVAVSSNMCLGATGTDDGGSIRVPAAFCGIVGLKPTWGSVDLKGIVPFSASLDHAGPLAKSPSDALTLLRAMGCVETRPATVASRRLRVGFDNSYFGRFIHPEVHKSVGEALRLLGQGLEADVSEVNIFGIDQALDALLVILFSEAASLHSKFLDTRLAAYAPDVRMSLLSGRLYRAVDYLSAMRARDRFRSSLNDVFETIDILVTPTVPFEAPLWSDSKVSTRDGELDLLEAIVRCTAPFDLSGHPALSLPFGKGQHGLPLGLQLIGGLGSESLLVQVGEWLMSEVTDGKDSTRAL